MKRAILPITLTLVGLGAAFAFFWWVFTGQREDVATARNFLTHLGTQDFDQARTLMSPQLAALAANGALEQTFGQIEAWESLRFGERSSNTSNGSRATEMWGLGTTVSGCESELYVRVRDGLIEGVDVSPLCPMLGQDA